jgi:hypothetical protein
MIRIAAPAPGIDHDEDVGSDLADRLDPSFAVVGPHILAGDPARREQAAGIGKI